MFDKELIVHVLPHTCVKFANAMFDGRVGGPDRHGYLRTTRVNVRTPIFSLYGVKAAAAAAASKADITLLYYIHTSKHVYIYIHYLFGRQHSAEKRITLKQWTYGFYIPFCRNIHVFVIVRGSLKGRQIVTDTGINKTGWHMITSTKGWLFTGGRPKSCVCGA